MRNFYQFKDTLLKWLLTDNVNEFKEVRKCLIGLIKIEAWSTLTVKSPIVNSFSREIFSKLKLESSEWNCTRFRPKLTQYDVAKTDCVLLMNKQADVQILVRC